MLCVGGKTTSSLMLGKQCGDALFLQKYWLQQPSLSAVMVPGWHRMSYYFESESTNVQSVELVKIIKRLHEVVGNANIEKKHIVFGNGVTQLLTGLVIVLSKYERVILPRPIKSIVADVPYYPVFKKQTTYFQDRGYRWAGNASDHKFTKHPENYIELVTSPNNPDGMLKRKKITNAKAITDRVYYWPHYTEISHPADDDIMLFSMSKFTGHAGSRFGWALIKDEVVYNDLKTYMAESSEGTSRDTQLRTFVLVSKIVKQTDTSHHSSDNIFKFGYITLSRRWKALKKLVSSSDRFALQDLKPGDCTYFGKNRDPSPGFGWLNCRWEEDHDCAAVLKAGHILTQGGQLFDASSRYARLSLIKTDDDFDQLMEKLKLLVYERRT